MTIAATILHQLGGARFAFMTGAKTFIDSGDTLRFTLPRPRALMSITLDASDTYTVRRLSRTGRETDRRDGVYADQLRDVFTSMTGLYTSL